MERTACVDVSALPLQLLLRRHPEWTRYPVVVVDRDKPSGVIEWVNESGYARRIVPGMRYAAGLALARTLRGGVVPRTEIDEGIAFITQRLWGFSPRIEPSSREPGVFWLDASGLRCVYPSLDTWASYIRNDLHETGFNATVAVGFSRFGCYAAARADKGVVFESLEQERAFLRRVPLARLGLNADFRDTLSKLGIQTLGAFLDLPIAGVRRRFGSLAEELHRLARGDGWFPLMPIPLIEPLECAESFDYPVEDRERLLATVIGLLETILVALSTRHETLSCIQFALTLDDGNEQRGEVSPAIPTLDAIQILSLIRLRFESLSLSSGVVELKLHALGAKTSPRQLTLFSDISPRHLEAAERGLAQVRAQLGNGAVVCARVAEGHLPEARFAWEPLRSLTIPKPCDVTIPPLVRRLFSPPIPLPPRDRHEPDGWLIAGVADGPVDEMVGPYTLCGAWWTKEVSRDYYYVRTRSGRLLWIYHDHERRRWFLHGELQ